MSLHKPKLIEDVLCVDEFDDLCAFRASDAAFESIKREVSGWNFGVHSILARSHSNLDATRRCWNLVADFVSRYILVISVRSRALQTGT